MPAGMPSDPLEQRASTIVLVGSFNPRIFQPLWFSARELLSEADVDAQSLVLTDGLSVFETEYVSFLCAQDRCQFATTAHTPTPDVIRDLAIGAFSILRDTPIWECGINHSAHVPASVRRWDHVVAQFGDPQKTLVLL